MKEKYKQSKKKNLSMMKSIMKDQLKSKNKSNYI